MIRQGLVLACALTLGAVAARAENAISTDGLKASNTAVTVGTVTTEKDGYVVVRGLFSPDEVAHYRNHYTSLREKGRYPGDQRVAVDHGQHRLAIVLVAVPAEIAEL